jgi:hypothetical protein
MKKKLIKIRLAAVLILVLLAGCASVPMAARELDQEGKSFAANPQYGTVYVYRVEGLYSVFPILVDGQTLGSLAGATYLIALLSPGQHVVSVTGPESHDQLKLSAEPGQLYFVRVDMGLGWMSPRAHFAPLKVNDDISRDEVSRLCIRAVSLTDP